MSRGSSFPYHSQGELEEEDIHTAEGLPRPLVYALFGMAFAGVVVCCYVLIMMGTALVSLGSTASASPQDEGGFIVLMKNLPFGCDTTLDPTLFEGIEGDPASYEWYGPFAPASGPDPDVIIPEGIHAISLMTSDGNTRSTPLTCLVKVEPAVTFSLHAKRGRVVIDLPDKEGTQRLDVYRARASDPSGLKKIAQVSPGTVTYTDVTVEEDTYLYAIAVLSGGQWSFSGIKAAHPYSLLPRWNYQPVICSLPVIDAYVGLPYTYDVLATDPQDDELTYSLDYPHEGMLIDPETGSIEWLPETPGDYETTVHVSDRKGRVTSQTFIIEVSELSEPNRMPVADTGGPYTAEVGQPLIFNATDSHDPDGGTVSCQWSFGDGRHDTGILPVHTYDASGSYQAVLTVTDDQGGQSSSSTTVTVHECLAPKVNLSINPAAVEPGEPCSLVWSSEKADTLDMDHGIGPVGSSGSLMIYPEETTTITMTATGRCGTASTSVTALVYEPPALNCSTSVSSIRAGETVLLTWTSSNADTVTIDQGIGAVMPDGMLSLSPDKTISYTVIARGPGGTVTRSITVEVLQGTWVDLEASPLSVSPGQASALSWDSSESESVFIDQGIGPVAPTGFLEILPQTTTTYTITATGPWGMASDEVTIAVHPPPELHVLADPPVVVHGQGAIISWTTDHATTVYMDNGIGEVGVHGSMILAPSETTIYTLEAEGEGGHATASVTIKVPRKPEVVMAVYPNVIYAGEECTLTWTSTDAVKVTIDNDIGPVPLNGFIEVNPEATTTYTITTVDGSGRSSTGQVTVTITQPLPDTLPDPPDDRPNRAPP